MAETGDFGTLYIGSHPWRVLAGSAVTPLESGLENRRDLGNRRHRSRET